MWHPKVPEMIIFTALALALFLLLSKLAFGSGLTIPSPIFQHPSKDVRVAIEKAAEKYKVNLHVLLAMGCVESKFNPKNHNREDPSHGLFQIKSTTASEYCGLSVKQLYYTNPNAMCAAKYLAHQLKRYSGNYRKAVSAYNAGSYRLCSSPYRKRGFKCKTGDPFNVSYLYEVMDKYHYFLRKTLEPPELSRLILNPFYE